MAKYSVGDFMSLERGQKIRGRYRIIQELRIGGQAQTYLAEDCNQEAPSQNQCIIKQLNQRKLTDKSTLLTARKRFEIEAETLKKLCIHPQIPALIDYFEEEQELYLVQEYIDGSDLKQKLEESGPWKEQDVISMLKEILPTLTYIHQQKIIHRDIKPSNLVMREHDNKIFVIDFGIVKELNNLLTSFTATGQSPGTLIYMAPEHRKNKPCFSSDLYSLGLVAIEALIGEYSPPVLETGEVIWSQEGISRDLADILNKMVHHSVQHRYESAQEVFEHLMNIPLQPSTIIHGRYKIQRRIG
ncbi:serine/threonine protein kinase [Nostoc sp. DSM 114167]|jgi:serine/threonine protein kinase|uniref:serine/threonine protein kinase n=1 Tax=Nostoc sp. DSM 114167 TaxID=3439050 RepID=UPI0040462902